MLFYRLACRKTMTWTAVQVCAFWIGRAKEKAELEGLQGNFQLCGMFGVVHGQVSVLQRNHLLKQRAQCTSVPVTHKLYFE